jgi:predicted nucleic acid-binding protein
MTELFLDTSFVLALELKDERHHQAVKSYWQSKVPQEIAEIYRKATENERQQMAIRIGVILQNSMRTRSEALAQLRQTMDEISAEAIDKGLTQEILESILNNND